MAHQVVGLDIGTYSIKAAVFETTFRSMTLRNLIESSPIQTQDIDPDQYRQRLSQAIAQFIKQYKLEGATFCSTLSGKDIILRIKEYPFAAKQVQKVLPNDIADEIPIPVEELMIEQHHFLKEKTRTVTHAVCAQNQVIQNHLDIIQEAGIEPSMISVDSIALFNIQQFLQHHPFNTYAIVDIGHTKTSICVICNQELAFVRTIYSAGFDISESIREQLDLTEDQANEVKEQHGIIETDFHPVKNADLKKLSKAIVNVVDPLFREILQSFHMYRSQKFLEKEQKKIEHVFFCGGSSLIKNLPEHFASIVNMPASIIDLEKTGVNMNIKSSARFTPAISSALKFASRSKHQLPKDTINYRKGPYSLVQDYGKHKDKFLFYAKWFLAFFVLLLTLFMFKNQSTKARFKTSEKNALRAYKNYIPDAKKAKNSKAAIKSLKSQVQKLQDKKALLTSGLDQLTALGLLREISLRIPPEVKLDTQEVSIDQNKVTLRAQTTSFAAVDQIIGYLEEVAFFDRIEKGKMSEKENKLIQFQLTIIIGESKVNDEDTSDQEEE